MRTSRSRTIALAAAGTAALALSLTACGGDGSGVRTAGVAETTVVTDVSEQPEQSDPAGEGKTGGAADVKTGGAADETTAVSRAENPATATPACTTKDVRISAARHSGPPYTHIVLTARNTSGHSCRMTGHPEIQFLEGHRENVPPVAKSRPAAPVVLKAGAPAYALVRLSNGGVDEPNEPVSGFSVTLRGGGGTAAVKAPGRGGVAVDPAAWKTGYWTYELRDDADDF
ncbi:DUF4232 domain-containing protein [Streptomyces sp. DSM 118878]